MDLTQKRNPLMWNKLITQLFHNYLPYLTSEVRMIDRLSYNMIIVGDNIDFRQEPK